MYRKMLSAIIGLILLGIAFVPDGRADETDKKTIVTVKEPIQVPGKVLPVGTYVFKLLNPSDLTLVGIYTADEKHLIISIQGISDTLSEAPDKTVFQFEERPSGQPEALKAWFYPGDNAGVEFVYPEQ